MVPEYHSGVTVFGWVSLLNYEHGIAHVPVKKVYYECRPCLRPPPTPLNGAVQQPCPNREGHLIRLCIFFWGGCFTFLPLMCPCQRHAVYAVRPPESPMQGTHHIRGTKHLAAVGPGR